MRTPSTPDIERALLIACSMACWWFSPLTALPTAVAAASASPASLQKTVAASASPKLSAWLNRPELVASPIGKSVSRKPNFFESGSSPAASATSIGLSDIAEISPPFSIAATLQPCCIISFTARSARTPATAAIGPTSAFCATSAMSLATRGCCGAGKGLSV